MKALLASAAVVVALAAPAAALGPDPRLADATAFFWDGSSMNVSGMISTNPKNNWSLQDYSTGYGKPEDGTDACIVYIRELVGQWPQGIPRLTRINFRKMPPSSAFTIKQSNPENYRSFQYEANAPLPDGAMSVDGGPSRTSIRLRDARGETLLRRRLQALDYIRTKLCDPD